MNPDPVKTTGTVSVALSAPASVTVRILTSQGALVRTLLSGGARSAGTITLVWDRKDGAGHRMAKGTYRIVADATDAAGQSATASSAFAIA